MTVTLNEVVQHQKKVMTQKMRKEEQEKKDRPKQLKKQLKHQLRQAMEGTESMHSYSLITDVPSQSKSKERRSKTSRDPGTSSTDVSRTQHCFCGTIPTLFTCRKEGPNWMRQFYRCSRPRNQQCQYFKWIGPAKSEQHLMMQHQDLMHPENIPINSPSNSEKTSSSFSEDNHSSSEESSSPVPPPISGHKGITKKKEVPKSSSNSVDWERVSDMGNGCHHDWNRQGTNAHQEKRTCKTCGLIVVHHYKTGEITRTMPPKSKESKSSNSKPKKNK